MAKNSKKGIYQLPNGNWGFRISININGKKTDIKRTKDEFGQPLKTANSAIKARELAIRLEYSNLYKRSEKPCMTVKEVYKEYCQTGRTGKAYATIRKQDSLWRNHIESKFGKRYIDDISVSEVNDYLAYLYYDEGRAYKYVEGFLKMFYLIFGQAYSRNYLDIEIYNTLCVNKNTRITMPKMKIDEDTDIVVFSQDELQRLDGYFKGTNAETAYMLGRYCGLRINECYGLKWADIDFENSSIRVERQMQYQEGLIKLVPLKTRNAKRTIFMCDKLKEYLLKAYEQYQQAEKTLTAQRLQNQTMIVNTNGNLASCTILVNTLPNGKIQTVNSMKYHAKEIKRTLGISFKFHWLRHTYGTRLAELNTPTHILCNQMGHGSGKVTEQYYLAVSKSGIELLKDKIDNL